MKFRRLERNSNMADELPPSKVRIDPKAQEAIDSVDGLLNKYREPVDLELGLTAIKQRLIEIQSDNHSS
jgi:hypothetical protein